MPETADASVQAVELALLRLKTKALLHPASRHDEDIPAAIRSLERAWAEHRMEYFELKARYARALDGIRG